MAANPRHGPAPPISRTLSNRIQLIAWEDNPTERGRWKNLGWDPTLERWFVDRWRICTISDSHDGSCFEVVWSSMGLPVALIPWALGNNSPENSRGTNFPTTFTRCFVKTTTNIIELSRKRLNAEFSTSSLRNPLHSLPLTANISQNLIALFYQVNDHDQGTRGPLHVVIFVNISAILL